MAMAQYLAQLLGWKHYEARLMAYGFFLLLKDVHDIERTYMSPICPMASTPMDIEAKNTEFAM